VTPAQSLYIDGRWVAPQVPRFIDIVDPAVAEPYAQIALGDVADVEYAVQAAARAFDSFSRTTVRERIGLLRRVSELYKTRIDDIASALVREIGAPAALARGQALGGAAHIDKVIETLETFPFEEPKGRSRILRQPIGVCALISPWNNPVAQVITKAIPAIAAGCTTVNKPSELAPHAVGILTEVMHEAATPPGVFNLVQGEGETVGAAMASHPRVDLVAITGSTRAGVAVARAAAETVKRVLQELGGKGPNVILSDADLETAVRGGVLGCFFFAGQTCGAPSRMLVPEHLLEQVIEIAARTARAVKVGPPLTAGVDYGPVINRRQFDRVQRLIALGEQQGAQLIAGGCGRPEGLERGYYCRPTVFARVTSDMALAREEVFGPVLSILTYRDEEQAIRLANDCEYGLVGYVQSGDLQHGARVASRIRCGYVSVNYAPLDISVPHGGYRRSGNGRQWGEHGLSEYLEMTSLVLPP